MTARQWTFVMWGLLGTGVAACIIVAAIPEGRLPTLGAVVDRLSANRMVMWVLVVGWMWLGWHSFAR